MLHISITYSGFKQPCMLESIATPFLLSSFDIIGLYSIMLSLVCFFVCLYLDHIINRETIVLKHDVNIFNYVEELGLI